MIEFLLAVAVLAFGRGVLNIVGEMMAGRDSATLEWGVILAVTLVGSGLFWIWSWNGVLALLTPVAVWSLVGSLLERRQT